MEIRKYDKLTDVPGKVLEMLEHLKTDFWIEFVFYIDNVIVYWFHPFKKLQHLQNSKIADLKNGLMCIVHVHL